MTKRKQKWKSAAHKAQHEELQKSWAELQKKYPPSTKVGSSSRSTLNSLYRVPPGRTSNAHIPSVSDSIGVGAKRDIKVYTGEKMRGISGTHKSNDIPIFSDDEIKDHARMRR